jgi:hypothetical protein
MTTPDDPTNPTGTPGGDPTEDQLRAALGARAASVSPGEPDAGALGAAIAADSRNRLRRNRVLMGAAAAAVLIVAVALAGTVGDGDPDRIIAGSDVETTAAPETIPDPVPPADTTTEPSAPTTTTETTVAETTTSTAPPTTTTTAAPPVLAGATLDPKSGDRSGNERATMNDLRVGCNAGFDRVVLEFQDGMMPAWTVGYVEPPIREDGSGNTVQVAGDAFLQILLEGAAGHDIETAEPVYTGPSRVGSGCAEVIEVVRNSEFEAMYSWTAGLNHKAPFRVSTLSGPSRLVVDIAHTS